MSGININKLMKMKKKDPGIFKSKAIIAKKMPKSVYNKHEKGEYKNLKVKRDNHEIL